MPHLHFGKYCEHRILAELLTLQLDVYIPIVDDRGIDYLIRKSNGTTIELQVKGREEGKPWIFPIDHFKPRRNYFFALIPPDKKIYIVPSDKIRSWFNRKKGGISFTNALKKELEEKYLHKFGLLK